MKLLTKDEDDLKIWLNARRIVILKITNSMGKMNCLNGTVESNK
jgi:hypothetical protein